MSGAEVWTAVGVLAMEALVLIAVAGVFASRVRSPQWERTVWQACFAALLGLMVMEFSGGARALERLAMRPRREPKIEARAVGLGREGREGREGKNGMQGVPVSQVAQVAQVAQVPIVQRAGDVGRSSGLLLARVFVGVWFFGVLLVFGLHGVARWRFVRVLRGSRELKEGSVLQRVQGLSGQLRMRRRIRVFESARLVSPVAWGTLRPAIGLPAGFEQESSEGEQEAMLAHEVAHVAAGDPAWYLLADFLSALLWWHPVVTWARRRLHAASETAADEASLLVLDGPGVLAQSLVTLGARLERPRPAAWLGIEGAGFRSGLARRVERLLEISGRTWSPPGRGRAVLVRTMVPVVAVVALIFCVAWTVPETSTHGENMKQSRWKRSIGVLGLISTLAVAEEPGRAAEPAKTKTTNEAHAVEAPVSHARRSATTAGEIKAKLESVVLEEVTYDNLPLGEVIKALRNESLARDPQKVGVNFMFGQSAESIRPVPMAIDPATGLPARGAAVEIQDPATVTIRIVPPLKKIRLLDALDAVVRVADRPIKYTIEGYAVVWALDGERINALASGVVAPPAPPLVLQTQAFKVDTNVFFPSLHKMFGVAADPDGKDTGEQLRYRVFPRVGVNLDSERLVLYNPLTGIVLVRATMEEFPAIQACMDALSGKAVASAGNGSQKGDGAALSRK